jgi:hypothetical protein
MAFVHNGSPSVALQSAINLSAALIRSGKPAPMAHRIAANKFGVDAKAIAAGVGARGGKTKKAKPGDLVYKRMSDY